MTDDHDYLEHIKTTKSVRTYQTYKRSLTRYNDFLLERLNSGEYVEDEFGEKGVRISFRVINVDFPKYLLSSYSGMTPKQVLQIIQHVRIFLEWQDKQSGITLANMLHYDQFADRKYLKQSARTYEIGHSAIRQAITYLSNSAHTPRSLSILIAVLLISEHGLQNSELLALRPSDYLAGELNIRSRGGKNRLIHPDLEIGILIDRYMNMRNSMSNDACEYFFPSFQPNSDYDVKESRMNARTLQRQFAVISNAIGIKDFTPRTVRALAISTLRESATVSELRQTMGWHKDYSGYYYRKTLGDSTQ